MKTKTFLCVGVVYLCLAAVALAQPVVQWAKCFGGSEHDYARCVLQTADGGYIVTGEAWSIDGQITGNHGGSDVWMIMLDATGNLQWQMTHGGFLADVPRCIQQTTDGGYVVACLTNSNNDDVSGNHGNTDAWVFKTDGTGNLQWETCLGGSINDYGRSVQQTFDGGYIVAGYTSSNDGNATGNHGAEDYMVVKLNSTGDVQWHKCYGGTAGEEAYCIRQTIDSGFVVAGYARSHDGDVTGAHGTTTEDYWIIKLNAAGALLWQKCLGGTGGEIPYSIEQTHDGGFIAAGYTFSNDSDVAGNRGTADYWVTKTDGSGNLQWQKCLGGSAGEIAYSIKETRDHGFIVAGNAQSNDSDVTGNHGNGDFWVVQLDSVGNIKWQKCLGGAYNDYAFSIQQTSDDGFIVAGYTASNDGDVTGNHGGADFWVVKLSAGNIGIPEMQSLQFPITLSPNPVTQNIFQLTFSLYQSSEIKFTLMSVEGKEITTWNRTLSGRSEISETFLLPLSLANGIYFLKVTTADVGMQVLKLVVSR